MGHKNNKNQNGYTMFNENTSSSEITQGRGNQRENSSEEETSFEDNNLNFPPLATVGNNLRSRFQSVVERQLSSLRNPEELTFAPRKTFLSSFSQTDFNLQETERNFRESNEMDKIQLWNVIVKLQELTQDLNAYGNEVSSPDDDAGQQHRLSILENGIDKKLPDMESRLVLLLSKGGGRNLRPSVRQVVESKIEDLYNQMLEVSTLPERPVFLAKMQKVMMMAKMLIHNLQKNPTETEEQGHVIRPIADDSNRTAEVDQPRQMMGQPKSDRRGSILEPSYNQQTVTTEPKHNRWLREDETGYQVESILPRQQEPNQAGMTGSEADPSNEVPSEYPASQEERQKMPAQQYTHAQNKMPGHEVLDEQYDIGLGQSGEMARARPELDAMARAQAQKHGTRPQAKNLSKETSKWLPAKEILGRQYTAGTDAEPTQQIYNHQYAADAKTEPSTAMPEHQPENRQYSPDAQTSRSKWLPAHKILNRQHATDNEADLPRNVPRHTMASGKYVDVSESEQLTRVPEQQRVNRGQISDNEGSRSKWLPAQKILNSQYATGTDKEPLRDTAYTEQPSMMSAQQTTSPEYKTEKRKSRWMQPQEILSRQYKDETNDEQLRDMPKQQMMNQQYGADTETKQSRWLPAQKILGRQYTTDTEDEQSSIMPTQQMAAQQHTTGTEGKHLRWLPAQKILGGQYTSDNEEEQSGIMPTQQMAVQLYATGTEGKQSRWLPAQKILGRQHTIDNEEDQSGIMPTQQMAVQPYSTGTKGKQSRWLPAHKILDRQHTSDNEEDQSGIMPTQQMAVQPYATGANGKQSRWLPAQKILGRQYTSDNEEDQSGIMPTQQMTGQPYATGTDSKQSRWLPAQKILGRQYANEEQSSINPTQQMAGQQYTVGTEGKQSRWLPAQKILGRQYATDTEEDHSSMMPYQQAGRLQYWTDSEVSPLSHFQKAAKRQIQHGKFRSAFESQRNRMKSSSESKTLHEELSTDSDEGTSHTALAQNKGRTGTVSMDPDTLRTGLKKDTDELPVSSESSALESDPSSEIMSGYSEYSTDIDITFPVMSETPGYQDIGEIGDKTLKSKYVPKIYKPTRQEFALNRTNYENSIDKVAMGKHEVIPMFDKYGKDITKGDGKKDKHEKGKAGEENLDRSKTREKTGRAKDISADHRKRENMQDNEFKSDFTSSDDQVPESDRRRYKRKYEISVDGKAKEDLEGDVYKRKRTRKNEPLEEESSTENGVSNIDNKTDFRQSPRETKREDGKMVRTGYKPKKDLSAVKKEDSNTSIYYSDSSGGESELENEHEDTRVKKMAKLGNENKAKQNKEFVNLREKKIYPCYCQDCRNSKYERKMGLSNNETWGEESYGIRNLFVNFVRFWGDTVTGLLFLVIIMSVFSWSNPRPIPGTISDYLDMRHITQPPF